MNINRNNYEEYFLLYTDNELSEAERQAVESFAEQNPDLKNELLGFQDAVLHADEDVKFPGKKELLSSNASLSIINNGNYTEYFLLYADNELKNEEKGQVEQYVYHNPELQEEFELILAVRTEPDRSIVFENKESLMRKAEGARVIAGWLKFAASAAAVLIFIVFGYLKYNEGTEAGNSSMISQQVEKTTDSQSRRKPLITIDNTIEADTAAHIEPAIVPEATSEVPAAEAHRETAVSSQKKSPSVKTTQDHTITKQLDPDKSITTVVPRDVIAADVPEAINKDADISVDHVQSLHQENLQIKAPVVIVKIDEEATRDSDVSIAGIPVPPTSKVGNFISRTSRFIKKTRKEISTKSEQVLGNFEIAIR